MTTKVTEKGLLLPKDLFGDVDEVEIRKEQDFILIIPVQAGDPIFELGKQPVEIDVDDASLEHDKYLYPA